MLSKHLQISVCCLLLSLAGCFQTSLNGPVSDATVTITSVEDPEQILLRTTSSNQESVPPAKWDTLKPISQLAKLGRVNIDGEFDPQQYYLVTAEAGLDQDTDFDLEVDTQGRPVSGVWHALMTGAQLTQRGRNVSVLTEAIYQAVAGELDSLNTDQLASRLDALAAGVVTLELSGDDSIGYEDALRWTRFLRNQGLSADLGDLNRLALAIQEGRPGDTVQILSNRFLDGPAAFGPDDQAAVTTLRRDADGSCTGRAAAIVSSARESISTFPPAAACGESDAGLVTSSQGSSVAEIQPAQDGLPRAIEVGDTRIEIDARSNATVRISYAFETDQELQSTSTTDPSPEKQQRISNAYKRMQGLLGSDLIAVPVAMSIKAKNSIKADEADPAFVDGLADTLSYGSLASNWAACLLHGLFNELEASGEQIPSATRAWAIDGCASVISEVEVWVAEVPATDIEQFQASVAAVELEGCADCYSYIVAPVAGQPMPAGSPVNFNAVAASSAEKVSWDFGDGEVFEGRSTQHTYAEPGQYTARFDVIYSDGSDASTQVTVNIEPPVSDKDYLGQVFFDDFDGGSKTGPGVTANWSREGARVPVKGYAGLGNAGNSFGGIFLHNTTGGHASESQMEGVPSTPSRLTLTGLPAHSSVDLNFLFAKIGSWDGGCVATECGEYGPDIFEVRVDGKVVFSESAGWPDTGASFEPGPPVLLADLLPLGFSDWDSAYDMGSLNRLSNVPHTSGTIVVEWRAKGAGWQGADDESFAIDNIEIIVAQ